MRSASPPTRLSTEVLLLRHAATRWNDEHRRLGWTDQPLTPAGRSAAAEWARREIQRPGAVCCSDLRRARETARIIAAALGLGLPRESHGLREQHQGEWTGLTKEDIKLRWPERLRERSRGPVGGETPEVVLARVLQALGTLVRARPGGRVLVVTHSGVIRALERAMSVEAPPVPHLQGRWLAVCGARARAEPAVEMLRAGELTTGRLVAGDGRPRPQTRRGADGAARC